MKDEILSIAPFLEGSFPIRYLGVPLISSRLFTSDCKILVEKVKNRIDDWKNKSLSFAGRLQLIVSVLSSMQIYWSSVFMLPNLITGQIEKLIRGFRKEAKQKWLRILYVFLKIKQVWESVTLRFGILLLWQCTFVIF